MQTNVLPVASRQGSGKGAARKLRSAGKVPGVVYGEGKPARSIELDSAHFDRFIRAGSHHGLIEIAFGEGEPPVKALVREIQVHPVTRHVEHVDLQRVSMRHRIRIEVPIVLIGKPEGVKNQGGILEHNLRNVEVECLPSDIPEKIEVDVSALNVGQSVHVSDLQVPGATMVGHLETTVATVSLPAAERAAEEETAEAVAGEEPVAEGETEGDKTDKSEKGDKDSKDSKGGKAEKGS